MPRRKTPTSIAKRTEDQAMVELQRSQEIDKVWKRDGNPVSRLSKLAKLAEDLGEVGAAASALNNLASFYAPRLRSLEVESEQKPVAVNINLDLTAADAK